MIKLKLNHLKSLNQYQIITITFNNYLKLKLNQLKNIKLINNNNNNIKSLI